MGSWPAAGGPPEGGRQPSWLSYRNVNIEWVWPTFRDLSWPPGRIRGLMP
jgi:hypothetical protein